MVLFSLVAAVAALVAVAVSAPMPADHVKGTPFKIRTCVGRGNQTFSGQYVTLQHVGAGESLLIMTPKAHDGVTFKFDKSRIVEPGTGYPLHLNKIRPSAETPSGYNFTAPKGFRSINLGSTHGATPGFHATYEHGIQYLYYDVKHHRLPLYDFAVCSVTGVGAYAFDADQLMWRTEKSTIPDDKVCSDVTLYGVFYDEKTGKFPKDDPCVGPPP